ncbi:MAG: DUF6249 domain-containing protein [Calditrichia bacterium]
MFSSEIVIVPVMFYALVTIVRVVSDNRLKRIMIERGDAEGNLELFTARSKVNDSANALKWGMVLVSVGLAFLIGNEFRHELDEPGLTGLVATFAGTGLLIYHFLVGRLEKKAE